MTSSKRGISLSVQQWRILLTLAHHPGATAVDIIAHWALQPMASAEPFVNCEQRGLIERRVGPSDRRSQELSLTRKGQRVYDTVVPEANPDTTTSWIAWRRKMEPVWHVHWSL